MATYSLHQPRHAAVASVTRHRPGFRFWLQRHYLLHWLLLFMVAALVVMLAARSAAGFVSALA